MYLQGTLLKKSAFVGKEPLYIIFTERKSSMVIFAFKRKRLHDSPQDIGTYYYIVKNITDIKVILVSMPLIYSCY